MLTGVPGSTNNPDSDEFLPRRVLRRGCWECPPGIERWHFPTGLLPGCGLVFIDDTLIKLVKEFYGFDVFYLFLGLSCRWFNHRFGKDQFEYLGILVLVGEMDHAEAQEQYWDEAADDAVTLWAVEQEIRPRVEHLPRAEQNRAIQQGMEDLQDARRRNRELEDRAIMSIWGPPTEAVSPSQSGSSQSSHEHIPTPWSRQRQVQQHVHQVLRDHDRRRLQHYRDIRINRSPGSPRPIFRRGGGWHENRQEADQLSRRKRLRYPSFSGSRRPQNSASNATSSAQRSSPGGFLPLGSTSPHQ